jgi:NSS family neurotransmitter:Na+ symporter
MVIKRGIRVEKKNGSFQFLYAPGTRTAVTERWSSNTLFIFGASSAAIGFNNIWQFPHAIVQYGGGAFLIVYVFCLLALGLPLLSAEIMLGRGGRGSPVLAMTRMGERARASSLWPVVGALGIVAGLIIFSYLSVIAGWVTAYAVRSSFGAFTALTVEGLNATFARIVRDPERQLFWHSVFIFLTMLVSARGLRLGLQPVIKLVAPILYALLLILLGYACVSDAIVPALIELFRPDFTKLSVSGIVAAMSHAFFSLGIGIGAMLAYGAYLKNDVSIPRASLVVLSIDTLAGLVAAVVVYSVLFSGGVDPAAGPELVFEALPLAFDHLPNGRVFGSLFFIVLVLAAFTSAIALIEPAVLWLQERFLITRLKAALICAATAWVLGAVTALSFNYWSFTFGFFGTIKKLGAFDVFQLFTAQLALPITGILMALFAGWVVRAEVARRQFAFASPCAFDAWIWLTRIAVPVMLLSVLLALPQLFA